jgi:uncharacterized protein YdcH (DUF465 family)
MLAFIHIPKTAGTTLHKILFHQYDRIFIHHDTDGNTNEILASAILKKKTQLIMGHFSATLHPFLPEVRYITCLRDPISRIRSHYNHALNDPTHYLHHAINKGSMDLAAYVSSGLSGELSNGMTRMLAGVCDFHHSPVDESTLALAKKNIETLFDSVILSEFFDSGLMLLAKSKNWKKPYYIRRKIGRYARSNVGNDSHFEELIREHNRFDCELYQWARDRFKLQQSQVPELTALTQSFQVENNIKGKVIFCMREIRKRFHMA